MKEEEYFKRMKEIDEYAKKQKKELSIKFAMSNQKYNIGDTLITKLRTIKAEFIIVRIKYGKNLPECVYGGSLLTKKLNPFKSGEKAYIFESDVMEVFITNEKLL